MNTPTILLDGITYDVKEGANITIHDENNMLGQTITISGLDYEFTATKITVKDKDVTYKIDKVKVSDAVKNKTISSETEETEISIKPAKEILEKLKSINFNKLKKPEIVDIANIIGFDTTINRTKKEWVEMITSLIK